MRHLTCRISCLLHFVTSSYLFSSWLHRLTHHLKHHWSTPRVQPEIWTQSDPSPVDFSVGDIRLQIAAEWLQIEQQSQWRAYRKPPSLLNGAITDPYDLPFPPKWGFHMHPRYVNGHISATGDPIHFVFGSRVWFSSSADRMALFPVTSNPSWRHLG